VPAAENQQEDERGEGEREEGPQSQAAPVLVRLGAGRHGELLSGEHVMRLAESSRIPRNPVLPRWDAELLGREDVVWLFDSSGIGGARSSVAFCLRHRPYGSRSMDEATRTELEAAAFRALVQHLRERTDVQNIDLMELAGFCRNCLSRWYREAAEERGIELEDSEAREIVYGMPYAEWKSRYQAPERAG